MLSTMAGRHEFLRQSQEGSDQRAKFQNNKAGIQEQSIPEREEDAEYEKKEKPG